MRMMDTIWHFVALRDREKKMEAGVGIEPTDRSFAVSEMRFTALQRVRRCSTGSTKTGKAAKKWNALKHGGTSANAEEQVYPGGVSRRF